ncbi:MAG: hypothetical protein R3E87_21190 [Burkholderiaceae bacterium]
MQTDVLACYLEALVANPGALSLTVLILFGSYLLFGLEPTEPKHDTEGRVSRHH